MYFKLARYIAVDTLMMVLGFSDQKRLLLLRLAMWSLDLLLYINGIYGINVEIRIKMKTECCAV